MTNTILSRATLARPGAALVLALALLTTLGLPAGTVHAQDVQVEGPLAGQPAVRHMRLYRQGRLRLTPTFSMTLQNEFTRALIVGAEASYGLTDWLSIGVWGAYSVAQLDTGLTDQVSGRGVTTDRNRLSLPSRGDFDNQIGNLNWFTSLHLTFIPLRGKLSFFQKLFVDTDFYVFAGAAIIGIEERANVRRNGGSSAVAGSGVCGDGAAVTDRDACLVDSQSRRLNRAQVAPTFGAGLSMYFNDFLGITVEWRGMPFAWNTSGTDERGPDGLFPDGAINYRDQIRHFNHMVTLGLVIYLPTAPEITD
ncbi:MAG: hypothetical protein H6726_16140 [Sandaracinaceae bacterium]|nr:hypothetical protein [Sandaracinaceae bacterium]